MLNVVEMLEKGLVMLAKFVGGVVGKFRKTEKDPYKY